MEYYLCYDLKGIQQYIFQIPKLKCIIGGSRQIDGFDRSLDHCTLGRKIFSGGGKGAFLCPDKESAEKLEKELQRKAFENALTIGFSISSDYTEAATKIQRYYYYVPENLKGQPCSLSGLYPTDAKSGIHPLIEKKLNEGCHNNSLETKFIEHLKADLKRDFKFLYDIDKPEEAQAIGNRNRWAVICMDGNDMGEQFRSFKAGSHTDAEWQDFLKNLSVSLDQCTVEAAYAGIRKIAEKCKTDLLPIRPLIVGGDDITLLVDCREAFDMVLTMMKHFQEHSRACGKNFPGTGGELSISAGILFAPVGVPLSSAIAYAEMLLASAKTGGRKFKQPGKPAPACLDWESVTEGILESPHARRQRELLFFDEALNRKVQLTRRPYTAEEFEKLQKKAEKYRKLPTSVCYRIHPGLFQSFDDRLAFYAGLGKNHPDLFKELFEAPDMSKRGSSWIVDGNTLSTDVVDALLLNEESRRMEHETVNQEGSKDEN